MFNFRSIKHGCYLPLLERYLLQKLSWFFLFSVCLLTSMGVAIGTVSDLVYKVSEYGLPLSVAIRIFGYKIPEYAAYALPISTLLTSLVVYGRLNSDRELVALFSFGVGYYRIVVPALLFSLAITLITFLLNESIVPAANFQANLLQNPFIPKTELNLQQHDIFYAEYQPRKINGAGKKLEYLYFARQYKAPEFKEIIVVNFDGGNVERVITASSARWNRQQQVWHLTDGKIDRFNSNDEQSIVEESEVTSISLPNTLFEIASQERSPEDMNIQQVKKYLKAIANSGNPREIAKFAVRIEQKYAFPFICVVFALIGSALSIRYEHNRAKSFGLCVAIAFGYYCLGFIIGALGITGIVSPFWAAWLPNAIGAIAGIYLLSFGELSFFDRTLGKIF